MTILFLNLVWAVPNFCSLKIVEIVHNWQQSDFD